MEKKLPIFKRGDYWYCYVRTPDGRRSQRALHLRDDGSPASYRAAVAAYWQEQARATSGQGDRAARERKPLKQALDALRAEQELAGLSEHSLDNTIYRGRVLMKHYSVNYDMQDITVESMVEYATKALETRAPVTVKLELLVLRMAAAAVGCKPPKAPKIRGSKSKRQQPLTREQLQAFYLALQPRQKLLGLSLITLGCRASEVAKIDDASIDWQEQTMWLRGTKTKGSLRQLPIPDELFAHMLELRARGAWCGFPKQSRQAVDQVVRAACMRAFGAARSVNDIRGAWSTLAALEGVPADVRAAWQGNSPEQQHSTYAQPALMPAEMRKAVMPGIPRITHASVSSDAADNPSTARRGSALKTFNK